MMPAGAELGHLRGYRLDVQRLRGVAVLAVVLFHVEGTLPGGYVGVDVFFVISGFVIARTLLAELREHGQLSLRDFYLRRARRLLPALAVLLTVVTLLVPFLAPAGSQARWTAAAAALFAANGYLFTQDGYFATAAEQNPLLHTWSLSVEEQFYFAFPALLVLAWRWRGTQRPVRATRVLVGVAIAVSLAASVFFSFAGTVAGLPGERLAFFSPVTRAWEFGFGVALALLPAAGTFRGWVARGTVLVGWAMICASVVLLSGDTVFPGAAAMLPVLGTALVIHGGTRAGPSASRGKQRRSDPLEWLGDLSYSWYLWHWPVIVFASAYWPDRGLEVPAIAATLSLIPAWASYRWVEERFRRTPIAIPDKGWRHLSLAPAAIATPLVAVALVQPLLAAVSSHPSVRAFEDARAFHIDLEAGCDRSTPLGEREPGSCEWGPGNASQRVVLLGDSQAGQFSEAFVGASEAGAFDLTIATTSACPFIDAAYETRSRDAAGCRTFVDGTLAALRVEPPDVVAIGITDGYHADEGARLTDLESGRQVSDPGDRQEVFAAALTRTVADLQEAGVTVLILGVIPRPADEWDVHGCSAAAIVVHTDRCGFPAFAPSEDGRFTAANALLGSVAAETGATVVDMSEEICPDDRCTLWNGDHITYRDRGHISVPMARALGATVHAGLDDVMLEPHRQR